MAWQFGIAVNATIAVAYAAIAWSVFRGLVASNQLRGNHLGAATGLIFTSCSIGHLGHMLHLVGSPGLATAVETSAARLAYDEHLVVIDLVTAAAAITFFTVKARQDSSERAGLYDDPATARRQALIVHEEVVQGLVLAGYQLDGDDVAGASATLSATLEQARSIASSPFAASDTFDGAPAARR